MDTPTGLVKLMTMGAMFISAGTSVDGGMAGASLPVSVASPSTAMTASTASTLASMRASTPPSTPASSVALSAPPSASPAGGIGQPMGIAPPPPIGGGAGTVMPAENELVLNEIAPPASIIAPVKAVLPSLARTVVLSSTRLTVASVGSAGSPPIAI